MSLSARKLLARNWRSGELTILLAALVLAVALVVAMSGLMTRFERILTAQSSQLLAADLVLQGRQSSRERWQNEATAQGLTVGETVVFPSMVFGREDAMSLASVKAVSSNYPLRGSLQISDSPFGEPVAVERGPQAGQLWLESRLLGLLDVAIGDKVDVGEASFTVTKVLRNEPDRGGSLFSMVPRVMVNIEDLPATQVLRAGSRASYSTLFAGDMQAIAAFKKQLTSDSDVGQQVVDADAGPSAVSKAMKNARRYLLLAASLGVMLAGIAVVLAARRFALRHLQDVAIIKSMGATASTIRKAYGFMLMHVAVIGIVAGSAVGIVFQQLLMLQLRPEAGFELSLSSLALGAFTAVVALAAFAWPPIFRLGAANPLRVLRRDLDNETVREHWDVALGVAGLSMLMWYYSRDLAMTLAVLVGVAFIAALTAMLSQLLLKAVRVVGMQAGSVWRLAVSGLLRHRTNNTLQLVIFALCFMLIFVLVLLRNTLLGDWRAQVPEGAPNHFMLNVQSAQLPDLKTQIAQLGFDAEAWYPMSRGRITAINGQALSSRDIGTNDRRARQRESNLSVSATLPKENTLVAGQWWDASKYANPVSLEQGYAQDLGLSVGDEVTYQIGAQVLTATVASIRSLRWESLRPNFFVLFPPSALESYPATWMSSFYLPKNKKSTLNTLVKNFPTVSIIEVDGIISQVQNLLKQIASVIELIVYLMLAAGALVMLAAVRASVDERRHESAVLRALGAPSRLLLGAQILEFSLLGITSGILAVMSAESASWLLHRQLSLAYELSWAYWPFAMALVMATVTLLGVLSCYRTVRTSPLVVLRDG